MPLSPVYDCELNHTIDSEYDYLLRSDLTEEGDDSCSYFLNDEC